jgi:hypothetical protein
MRITTKHKEYGNTKFQLLHATQDAVLFQNRNSQHVETDKYNKTVNSFQLETWFKFKLEHVKRRAALFSICNVGNE